MQDHTIPLSVLRQILPQIVTDVLPGRQFEVLVSPAAHIPGRGKLECVQPVEVEDGDRKVTVAAYCLIRLRLTQEELRRYLPEECGKSAAAAEDVPAAE